MATVPSIGRADAAGAAVAPVDATRALYERFARQIFAYCLVQLRNREEAEDAVQTTFLNAFRAIERGTVPELESAWLYRIAHHVCLTRRRSWSRRRAVESPEDFANVQELVGEPARDVGDLNGLTDALRELPEQQRRAILLREWQGLTYKEIAAEMEISQASVETLIFRARRSLAQSLEKLRASNDMGSVAAAIKSLLVGAGTKAAVALVTVATTTVVAATPEARHQVIHFVNAVSQVASAPSKPTHPAPAMHPVTAKAAVAVSSPALPHAPVGPVVAHPRRAAKARAERASAEPSPPATTDTTPTTARSAPAQPPTPAAAPATTTPAPITPTVAPAAPATPATSPAIGGFSPQSGTPGTIVQLSGHGFTGATAVRFYGVPADYVVNSDTSITAKVPATAVTGPITVVSPTAGDITSSASFTVSAPPLQTATTTSVTAPPPSTTAAPSIGGFNPQSGTPGTVVQLSGHGFTGATAVKFNGVPSDFTVNSDTSLTTRVPSNAISGQITVVSPTAGDITSSASFTVSTATNQSSSTGDGTTTTSTATPAPSIEGASPRTAQVGSSVLIVGKGFTGASAVKFNGVSASFTVNSDTQITAIVPTGATSGPFTVTTANGTATSSGSFTVSTAAAPSITGFSPSSAAIGATVGIGGSGFTGATAVKFNGVSASFTVSSDGVISAVVPAGATSGPVSVTTPNGTGSSTASFTVTH